MHLKTKIYKISKNNRIDTNILRFLGKILAALPSVSRAFNMSCECQSLQTLFSICALEISIYSF